MFLAAASHLVMTGAVQGQLALQPQRIKCLRMQLVNFSLNILQCNATYTGHGVGEVLTDNFRCNTDCLKDLRTLIGLDRTDTHLGSNLYNTVKDCIVIIIYCCIIVLIQHVIFNEFLDGILCQIRVDCTSTIAQKCCKMMYFSGFTGLQDQSNSGPLLGTYQILIQSRYCQQGRNCHMVLIHTSVRKNQYIDTVSVRSVCLYIQSVNRTLQAGIFIINNRHDLYFETFCLHIFDFHQIGVGQNRVIYLQNVTVLRRFLQQVTFCTDVNRGRSYDFLTNCINGRIGDLCK